MASLGRIINVKKELPTEASLTAQPSPAYVAPPEAQLRDAMIRAGVTPPHDIVMDGRLHRYATGDKRGDKSGWYIAYGDGVPAGSFGCWRSLGEGAVAWRSDICRALSYEEEVTFAAQQAAAKRLREAENARIKAAGAKAAQERWENASEECAAHPYIQRKGFAWNPGWRMDASGRLISPMLKDGVIVGTQSIGPEGDKQFDFGSTASGSWWHFGPVHGAVDRVYIVEGVATGVSVCNATERGVVVAYSAQNLPAVAKAVRDVVGAACELVIVADNDGTDKDGNVGGAGWAWAQKAAQQVAGCKAVLVPTWPGGPAKVDADDFARAGGDLRGLLEGDALVAASEVEEEWLVQADDWSQQPAPVKWLVKNWLQEDALIMVHGPSGSGKTFVALDWILRMASGGQQAEWAGKRVKQGTAVYLAGEGHQGLRGRIAGWKHKHGVGKLDMWLTRGGCDLNTPEGYAKVKQAIQKQGVTPSIIVVDTLHRFLLGDENKAQDAKTMLDACSNLMRDFGCSVLLVHHTGVSEEAQHRARGSSAWRGALDIEISVTPPKAPAKGPLEITQRKSKDAEMVASVYANLCSVEIPGWVDEDGEQVKTAIVEIAVDYDPGTSGSTEHTPKKPTAEEKALHGHKQTMRNAWQKGGRDTQDGQMYVSRSVLLAYLTTDCGKNQKTAENAIAPQGNMMRQLQQNGFCRPHLHGWVITDNDAPSDGGAAINIGALQANANKE